MLFGRIPFRIHPFFWWVILAIGWINSFSLIGTAIWAAVILLSVVVHECGHALTAQAFGQRVRIELFAFGGVTVRHGKQLRGWQEFLIVAAGPLAGFALFGVAYTFYQLFGGQPPNFFLYAVEVMIWVNLFWTLVNLLPLQPLDGGHLLRIVMEGLFGVRGIKAAFFFSFLLAALLSIFCFLLNNFLLGAIFLIFAFEGFRSWRALLSLSEIDRSHEVQQLLKEAEWELREGSKEQAEEKLQRVREKSKRGQLFQEATERLADLLFEGGRFREAYALISPIQSSLSLERLILLQKCAYENGHLEEAIACGNRAFMQTPRYDVALLNAFSHARLAEAEPAVGWLRSAVREGLPDYLHLFEREEFRSIQHTPAFQKLLVELGGQSSQRNNL